MISPFVNFHIDLAEKNPWFENDESTYFHPFLSLHLHLFQQMQYNARLTLLFPIWSLHIQSTHKGLHTHVVYVHYGKDRHAHFTPGSSDRHLENNCFPTKTPQTQTTLPTTSALYSTYTHRQHQTQTQTGLH